MNIETIKWQDNGNVMLVNGEMNIPYPCNTYHKEFIDAWLAIEGNDIAPEFTTTEIDEAAIVAIKEEASRQIVEIMPIWKQMNTLARAIELKDIETKTEAELAEEADIQSKWDAIKVIRLDSDAQEAVIRGE